MPRPAKLWRRTGRSGWWATIGGSKRCFGEDRKEAEAAFRRAKAEQAPSGKGARVRVGVAAVLVILVPVEIDPDLLGDDATGPGDQK